MPEVVSFTAPGQVALVSYDAAPLTPGSVRVRTWYSGISAGTELTAYRGSNPYLTGTWDPDRRLFVEGAPTFAYPVEGWGYSEVGEVVEVADGVTAPCGRRRRARHLGPPQRGGGPGRGGRVADLVRRRRDLRHLRPGRLHRAERGAGRRRAGRATRSRCSGRA